MKRKRSPISDRSKSQSSMLFFAQRAPSRPKAGEAILFFNQQTGKMSAIKSDGTIVSLEP